MLNRLKPPKSRQGFKWEFREGCNCEHCPWKGNCIGENTLYWIEVKENA